MYQTILLPIDLGHRSSWARALPTALALVGRFGAVLHLMTVVPEIDLGMTAVQFPKDYGLRAREEARQRLEAFARDRLPPPGQARLHVGHGVIYKEILNTAGEVGADLIVMSSHRPELRDYLLGPNSARVVRHAGCSVLVVRD